LFEAIVLYLLLWKCHLRLNDSDRLNHGQWCHHLLMLAYGLSIG
jgi:hypothetical protein